MATVNKDFRVKHGLVVEGSTATVNGSNVLTEASTTYLKNTVGTMVDGGTQSNITVTYDALTGKLNFAAENGVADSTTDNLVEGLVNKYFTQERAQDSAALLLDHAGHNGIEFTYDDANGKLTATVTGAAVPTFTSGIIFEGSTPNEFETTFAVTDPTADRTITFKDETGTVALLSDITSAVDAISTTVIEEGTNLYFTDERVDDRVKDLIIDGTGLNKSYDDGANTLTISIDSTVVTKDDVQTLTQKTLGTGTVLSADLNANSHKITALGTPINSTDAANKAYVDSVSEGLHIHPSVRAATTTNVNIASDLESGDTLDGVILAAGDRVLVKNQLLAAENGIYVVQSTGAAVRATDFDAPAEVDGGDFIFVTDGGTVNGNTGWVQTSTGVSVIGSDPIYFTQFSGAGTYLAGNGLTLTGNTFAIDTLTTVDLNSAQTLTNKTLSNPTVAGLYLSDNNITVEGTDNTHETTLTFTDPTQDNVITFKNATGTVAFVGDIPTSTSGLPEGLTNLYFTDERAQDAVKTLIDNGTQTNITVTYDDVNNALNFNASGGVSSVAGTADQINVSSSTGAVTFSLPQNISTSSTPTFAGVNVASVALTDALIGTAIKTISDGSATVVDSWSVSVYNSAKYIVQMKKGTDIEVIEVLVTVDGNNNVYLTEYANVISNAQIGTTDADYDNGNVRLLVTASNGTTVKVHKTLIEA